MSCDGCHGAGWQLDSVPNRSPISLELIPCVMPECIDSGRPIAILSIGGLFHEAVRHPATGAIMSLSAFRP